jgi:hypothetical protein
MASENEATMLMTAAPPAPAAPPAAAPPAVAAVFDVDVLRGRVREVLQGADLETVQERREKFRMTKC